MSAEDELKDQAHALVVQKHQLDAAGGQLARLDSTLHAMLAVQADNELNLDALLARAESQIAEQQVVVEVEGDDVFLVDTSFYVQTNELILQPRIETMDVMRLEEGGDWQAYLSEVAAYAQRHQIEFAPDPFRQLMTTSQRIALEKRIKEEFSLKAARCDKYDYMIGGTCGLIGGLIDVFFVGLPGESPLTRWSDNLTDKAVQKFASWQGWDGGPNAKDPVASAIGFLERKYKINYDHRHGGDVNHLFKMSTRNHHIKSLGHSPDLVGLFFSVLDQFTSTAHFVDNGKLISVDTETFELRGSNVIAKLFCGVTNWLGHLFSDVAGSSGAQSRGSGIPIPFYSLLQFVNVGEFGKHKQTFATIAVQVFEKGYDFRHGIALAIPVLVAELLTRLGWVLKQRFYHERPWAECLPLANNPELRRTLLVAHGTLCLVDGVDAAIRSTDMITFMLRSNVIAWARFGTLALKELKAWYREGGLDVDAVDEYLDSEYRRLLAA
ncbi:hypothetical protein AO735_08600 [Pseudomonas sp. TTU2014-096BSC]|nr:hypothetical protein AO735_08600 [Pseudomonas sp. TTU2014-096BSC]